MANQLWMLRHAEAVAQAPSGRDADRELTARGEQQARVAGTALRHLNVDLSAVLTSPKVRALQTAAIACEAIGVAAAVVYEPLVGGFSASDALDLAREADGERILVVGHNPDFAQVVHDLTGARIAFKKAAVAAIDLRERTLLALLRPHELRALA